MIFEFHPEAEQELYEAAAYYEERSPGLGRELIVEIFRAIDFARENPMAAAVIAGDRRRKVVSRFPYGVIYTVKEDRLRILAVMNLRRRPGYWSSRRIKGIILQNRVRSKSRRSAFGAPQVAEPPAERSAGGVGRAGACA